MADDPHNPHDRLERHAQQPVPPLDPAFANRLESQLRIGHADATSPRPWAVRSVVPRLAAAVALVVAGVAGIVSLTTDDAGVPVAVIDDGQPALLDAPSIDDGALPVDVTVTPTPTPVDAQGLNEAPVQSAVPTATPPALITPPATTPPDAPNVEPTAGAGAPTDPTPTSLPTQSTTPLASATPTGSPTPTQVPATPVATEPTVLPVPTATALPEPTPASTPEPRPTATATATPEIETAPIELTCAPRSTGDAVGVVCTWVAPVTDRTVAWYEVLRSRNGAEAEIVARQRVDESTSYVDRNVVSGDEATYLVQARNADDQVVGASIRQIVQVP